jgi:glutamate formiminotransferase/formiminotetrahydrofolate cyclodeaminase
MKQLMNMNLEAFANETASESPAPGGGSVSAYIGALGASLATMVANLSSNKAGWDDRWKEFSDAAETGMAVQKDLLELVDEDTRAFNRVMAAFGLPKASDEEKSERKKAIQVATIYAMEVPLKVMKRALGSFELIKTMAEDGNPASASDTGVAAICARSAILGAFLNVKINAAALEDKEFADQVIKEGKDIEAAAMKMEKEILKIVEGKIG